MGTYLLVVPSSAKDGRDDDYNEWYDNQHLQDLLSIDGVRSGRRFEADPRSPNPQPGRYLAIYEIELDDPSAVFAEMGRRSTDGTMSVSDALDFSSAQLWLYKAR